MAHKQDGLIPVAKVFGGLGWPVKALRLERPPQRGFTRADQVGLPRFSGQFLV